MQYQEVPQFTRGEIRAAIDRDDPEELLYAVLSAALYDPDPIWSEGICAQLATHADPNVRGNAILGFGHIARIHRTLDRSRVLPLIENALRDPHSYVRGHAEDTVDDLDLLLDWNIPYSSHQSGRG